MGRKRRKKRSENKRTEQDEFAVTLPKRHKRAKQSDDFAISGLNTDKVKGFMKNKRAITILSVAILIILAFGISWHFRDTTNRLPITEQWASNNVQQYYKNSIRQQVNQDYPNLPTQSKNEIVNKKYQAFYEQNKPMIDQNIKDAQLFFLDNLKNENGQTYMLNIDSFYYFRRARNIVETGTYYDSVKDGRPWDDYMLAPKGIPTTKDFHSYSTAYLYKFLHFFNRDITLLQVAFLIPILIASLSAIPIFFIVRRKAGNFGAFIAAALLVLHPVFMGRSMGGDFDTDVYQVFFPLLIVWLFLEVAEARSLRNKLVLSGIAGFFVGLFSFAWKGGWWFLFDFLIGVTAFYVWYELNKRLIEKVEKKRYLSPLMTRLVMFFGPFLLVGLFFMIHRYAAFAFIGLYGLVFLAYLAVILFKAYQAKSAKGKLPSADKDIAYTALFLLVFIISTTIFVSIFTHPRVMYTDPLSPLRITNLQIASKENYWPNVYTTVAELNVASFDETISAISNVGGIGNNYKLFFIIATIGIILGIIKKNADWKDYGLIGFSVIYYLILTTPSMLQLPASTYLALFVIPILIGMFMLLKDRSVDVKYAILLVLWFVATIYASTKGMRFINLLVPAFSVAFGVAIGIVYRALANLAHKELHLNRIVIKIALIILFSMLLIKPMDAAEKVADNHIPIFDQPWYEAMDAIKQDSPPDAIINSWWDFGHFFKAIADRPVTFDGAIQNTPPAHWIGKVLSTSNEKEAIGILRMLDCGQNDAFNLLVDETDDVLKSKSLVDDIILLDREDARQHLLDQGISAGTVSGVLEKSHCDPPEDYFITSGDMVGKAGVWSHFGYWDFEKSYIYRTVRNKDYDQAVQQLQQDLSISLQEADQYYLDVNALQTDRDANTWISPWPGYVSTSVKDCRTINNTVECVLNLGIGKDGQTTTVVEKAVVDLDDRDKSHIVVSVFDSSLQNRLASQVEKPNAFVLYTPEGVERLEFNSTFFPHDFVIDTHRGKVLIVHKLLSDSTFTKLFFFNGLHMKHFDKLFEKYSQAQGNVIVWKVDWDGKTDEEMEVLNEKWFPQKQVEQVENPDQDESVVEDVQSDVLPEDQLDVDDQDVESAGEDNNTNMS